MLFCVKSVLLNTNNYELKDWGKRMIAFMEKVKWTLLIFGIAVLGFGIFSGIKAHQKPITFDQLNLSNLKGGTMVEDEVLVNFGTYEEKYSTTLGIEDKSSKIWYYIIPASETEDKYMGIAVHVNEQGHIFDMQTDQTMAWLENGKITPTAIKVKGSVTKMSEQEQGFFLEALIAGGFSGQEAKQAMVPYYITTNAYSDYLTMIIIGACGIIISIICFVVVSKYE